MPGPQGGGLPNLVLIGAMKCGTSALHDYLDAHPSIAMSQPKELNFFVEPEPGAPGWSGNAHRGEGWYRRHFDPDAPVRGESSPGYTSPSHPDVAQRMALLLPRAKLLLMVRDPIDRAVSQWRHHRRDGAESRPPAAALADPASQYVTRGLYHERLQPFLDHYPVSQIMVVALEELAADPGTTLRRLFTFLGVDPDFWHDDYHRPVHSSDGTPPALDARTRARLVEALRPDADRLRALVGRDFPGWSL